MIERIRRLRARQKYLIYRLERTKNEVTKRKLEEQLEKIKERIEEIQKPLP